MPLTSLRSTDCPPSPAHQPPACSQVRPGVFEERTFRALDWVVAEAGRRGLRLILDLTNYWKVS